MEPPISPIRTIPDANVNITASEISGCGITIGILIFKEELDDIDVLGTREGVTTDTNAETLTKTDGSGLCNCLVGQSTRPRDDTCNVSERSVLASNEMANQSCQACGCVLA